MTWLLFSYSKNLTQTQRKDIKILKTLIESQWANEISAQASLNLNSKKWNKEELIPLTSDLKILKDYLEKNAQKAFAELRNNVKDKLAYNSLKEILYCQIILMNRRRPAEVAQIKVETYKSINLNVQEIEFESCLTPKEKNFANFLYPYGNKGQKRARSSCTAFSKYEGTI